MAALRLARRRCQGRQPRMGSERSGEPWQRGGEPHHGDRDVPHASRVSWWRVSNVKRSCS